MRTLILLILLSAFPAMAQGTTNELTEIYGQLDTQNRTISDLTKKVEELAHNQDILTEKLSKLQADIDIRFQEQEKKAALTPSSPSASTVNLTPDKKISDKEAYDTAYALLMKAKYKEAESAFQSFLKTYPESTLAGNANYWLGETYYVQKKYEVAAGIFSDGLTKYEKSSKAPDNLLKLGLTLENLNKKTEACASLKLLPQKFPKASETLKQRAQQEVKKLACP